MIRFLVRCAFVLGVIASLSGVRAGVVGAGSLADVPASVGSPPTHAWIALPDVEGARCMILHLPPRGTVSERSGRETGVDAGAAFGAAPLASVPEAMGAIGDQLAMVFADAGAGLTNLHGRPVLAISAVQSEPGVWRAAPGQRLETLPSLRADGLLLGFTGSPVGYVAVLQGLAGKDEDPRVLLLQVLTNAGWTSVPVPPDVQTFAAANFEIKDSKPATKATWRLLTTNKGIGIVMIPARKASDPISGSVYLADFSGTQPGGTPSATWSHRDLSIAVQGSPPSDQIDAIGCSDHIVLAVRDAGGRMHLYTQPFDTPVAWRQVAAVGGIAPDHAIMAMDGVGRVGVVSVARGKVDKGQPSLRFIEVSARTGAVAYDGELNVGGPMSGSDYRFVGVVLAYVTGLVIVFLWRPSAKDSLHLPAGVSIAEPTRRMLAGLIDATIGVVIACRIIGIPVAEFMGVWSSGPAQNAMVVAMGVLIVSGAVLESIFGRSLGKMLTGCGVVEMQSGTPKNGKEQQAKTPVLWRSLLRNAVKWGLPPLALFGLLEPGGRHRGDQLAGTAVVIEGEEEEEAPPES